MGDAEQAESGEQEDRARVTMKQMANSRGLEARTRRRDVHGGGGGDKDEERRVMLGVGD